MTRIALLADFNPNSETHAATTHALAHSANALGIGVEGTWIGTDEISTDVFKSFDGIWVGTGSPYRNLNNVLSTIECARKNDFPIFATCGGFQHMILEIARNELGFPEAAHAEYEPQAAQLFITPVECSLRGQELQIRLEPKSRAAQLYGSTEAHEKYYCSFGVNPEYAEDIKNSAIRVVGSDDEGELRVIEIPQHRFFMGTLYVPQAQSKQETPHPLVNGFLHAAAQRRA